MNKDLYQNLTTEEKLGLLHYERGAIGLIANDYYSDLKVNPNPTPQPRYLYISNVLGIDFEEFLDTDKAKENSKKNKNEWQKFGMELGGSVSWHIGDAISDIMYLMCRPNTGDEINEDLMNKIDAKLLVLYKSFVNAGTKYELIPDMEFKGEHVYRKVL